MKVSDFYDGALKEPLFGPFMGSNLFIGKQAFWFLIASAVR